MLNRAQLIARKGRARTQGAAHDVALDRKRWGCLPVDAVYNVYHVLDPLAQLLGPLCDRDWAREHAQPIAIPAQTSGMLTNIPTSFSKFWEGIAIPRPTRFAVTTTHPEAAEIVDAVDKHEQAEYEASMREVEGHNARQREREEAQAAMDAPPPLSERDQRAADRFKALNPTGILDY